MLSVINLILGEWMMVAWRNLSLIFLEISSEKHFFLCRITSSEPVSSVDLHFDY